MIQLHDSDEIEFFSADTSIILDLPFVSGGINVGFSLPSLKNEKSRDFESLLFSFLKIISFKPSLNS